MDPEKQPSKRGQVNQQLKRDLDIAKELVTEGNEVSKALTTLDPYLEKIGKDNPLFERLHTQLAWVHYKLGNNDTEEGRAHYRKSLESAERVGEGGKEPENSDAIACIATVLAQSVDDRDDARLF